MNTAEVDGGLHGATIAECMGREALARKKGSNGASTPTVGQSKTRLVVGGTFVDPRVNLMFTYWDLRKYVAR